jgi:hypothetical protein
LPIKLSFEDAKVSEDSLLYNEKEANKHHAEI